ncbi:4816_t:CDS:2 [Entrophospora sp. SA101]|nr:17379_t:CDS:2 [Entrophospora sp. SA101]CAJ0903366.1 4816_t:CDS:2 [Entrophospora sp. SA101]
MQREYQKEYEGTNEDVVLNKSIIRTTSSVYNPVEFLEYLASQEQYLPNVIEEVQNQIVGLKNSQSHSILDYQNNGIIDDNIYSSNINIITNNNLINQNQNNFISTGDINNNINVSNNDYNNNPQPQHTQLDNNTAENNRLKLSNVLLTLSPLSKSTDQQSLIPSKKPKPYKVKSGAFIMCLEIFILGVIILVSWKITDLTDGNTALFNITTGIGTIPIIHNKTTTNT